MTDSQGTRDVAATTPASGSSFPIQEFLWGALIVLGAVMYRPLTFWVDNAWDLSAPNELLPTIGVELVAALGLMALTTWISGRGFIASVAIGAVTFAVFNWTSVGQRIALAVFLAAIFGALWVAIRSTCEAKRYLTLAVLGLTLGLPIIQLVFAHFERRTPYPLVIVPPPGSAKATHQIDDIVVVIVDGYPMATIARQLGHDTVPLAETLNSAGFQTPDVSWSHNTFTSLALPTLLQLSQVVPPGPKGEWRNRKANYEIIRGHSFTVQAARAAGFRYTHIESGWNGDVCGDADNCLKNSWPDEANWELLADSTIGPPMEALWASANIGNTMTTVHNLTSLEIFDDGQRDLVYAHLMLPHAPFAVDAACRRLPANERTDAEDPARIPQQLDCVDSLVTDIIDHTGENTAMLIVGDHGAGIRHQTTKPASDWDDADIADRLGAFLAYRSPSACDGPEKPSNTFALRAIVSCALDVELPESDPTFTIGFQHPVEVDSERLERIDAELVAGTLSVKS